MKIIVIPDWNKKKSVKLGVEISGWLLKNGVFSTLLYGDKIKLAKKYDMAVLLGGDGFITRTSLEMAQHDLPFLAVNFGTKGFLAVAERNNWETVLRDVVNGRYTIEKRPILKAVHYSKEETECFEAAGDVYIRHRTSMINLSITIDGQLIYRNLFGDGVIVATPTGSTAYNLSAGGPIISIGTVITPICPYAVNVRSLPVSELKKIEIVYLGRKGNGEEDEGCLLHIDGVKHQIEPKDRVEIQKSPKETSFIIPQGFSFIRALQKKQGLST